MLFNSFLFLLIFLPIALLVHYLLGAWRTRLAALWLCVASFVFYGWWNPQFVVLLAGSITFNYLVSLGILALARRPRLQTLATARGVAATLVDGPEATVRLVWTPGCCDTATICTWSW